MEEKEIKNKNQSTQNNKQQANIGPLTMGLFVVTAVIYFATALYSYYENIEGQVSNNIALGIMFLGIGFTFWYPYKNKNKK